MTTEERRTLKPGHVVRVRNDFGETFVATVKYAPWQLGHGDWVVGLKGKAGGYDLDRVIAFDGE
jgi:hypothetical protein